MVPKESDNLFWKLHHWAHGQDENFCTEGLAYLLRYLVKSDPNTAVGLLEEFTAGGLSLGERAVQSSKIDTQVSHSPNGTPDMEWTGDDFLVLFEVKVSASLGEDQINDYLSILEASGARHQYLVILTLSKPPHIDDPRACRTTWHRLADRIERRLTTSGPSPVSQFLLREFHDFLKLRKLALARVSSCLSGAIRAWEEASGSRLIFDTPISLTFLAGEHGLEPVNDLVMAMKASITRSKIDLPISFGSGMGNGGWFGWNLDTMAYYFYANYEEPERLTFQLYQYADPEKFDGKQGLLLAESEKKMEVWRWSFDFHLLHDCHDFFSVPSEEQVRILSEFVQSSYEYAKPMRTSGPNQ